MGIVGRGVVDSGMRKIQNATILLLAGLFFCAGIVLLHGVRTDARLRVEEKERALRQEGVGPPADGGPGQHRRPDRTV